MKFSLVCCIRKDGNGYIAEGDNITIYNLLVKDDIKVDGVYRVYNFVVVVNKRGQLTVLCIE